MRRLKIGDLFLNLMIFTVLLFVAFSMLYPFWNAAVISFNDGFDTANGGLTFWPRVFTLDNYRLVFADSRLLNSLFISIARTAVGTLISIILTSTLGYALSKKYLIGRKFYMMLCILTLYFSGGLIPTYLLIRNLDMLNTFWVLVLPGALNVWNMIIFRTFFQNLPASLEESARVDGCNHLSLFMRIVFPISGPVFATLGLFTAVTYWNSWFDASIYVTRDDLLPLQNLLINIINSSIPPDQLKQIGGAAGNVHLAGVTQHSLMMATMMVAVIPIVLVYPFIQKFFVKGVLMGSLKE
ncbi:maltose ABC transporter permease [Dictyobacter alpinus]|uniref:Maltose ABC transporter permease n=1 Tax=Dictyobacter alpinus TaxID=2014873 RepID=A0A402B1B0_9CHLR|nr:maltose ABC transporter permease [Dictyobacter alpinus]